MRRATYVILLLLLVGGCSSQEEQPDYRPILEDIRAQLSDLHRLSTLILGRLEETPKPDPTNP